MPMAERRATATWEGNLQGKGQFSVGSGAIQDQAVTWASRTERSDGKTSPEELIAAAEATCFSMAFSNELNKAGSPPERLSVTAVCTLDRVDNKPTITTMNLEVVGRVPGMDEETFKAAAQEAAQGCPVSRSLKGNVQVNINARLEGGRGSEEGGSEGNSASSRNSTPSSGGTSTQTPEKPSQAEGDRETVEEDIEQKEQQGEV